MDVAGHGDEGVEFVVAFAAVVLESGGRGFSYILLDNGFSIVCSITCSEDESYLYPVRGF